MPRLFPIIATWCLASCQARYSTPPVITPVVAPVAAANYQSASKPASLSRVRHSGMISEGERYRKVPENPFYQTKTNPTSTFGADVDTASYSNVRRLINEGQPVPADAVRLEEMINYFPYDYPQPTNEPIAVAMESADCPWSSGDRILKLSLRTREVQAATRKRANLVFLVDVSGSMDSKNKLPLVKKSLSELVSNLNGDDTIAIVTYSGTPGLALPPTAARNKIRILQAIKNMESGGSTNGGEGIQLAYDTCRQNYIPGGVNRVILATDGDFNVGVTDPEDLVRLVREKAKGDLFLSVLGFGMGNIRDDLMEKIANDGNGNYAYIDTIDEARKTLTADASGALITVLKDVKLQLDWNPSAVSQYRLLGYENRVMDEADFNNDARDSGDIGAGQRVTVLYQYKPTAPTKSALGVLRIRGKAPESDASVLHEYPVNCGNTRFADATEDFRFASSVAGFGLLLSRSPYAGHLTCDAIAEWCSQARSNDPGGYRREFIKLVKKAQPQIDGAAE